LLFTQHGEPGTGIIDREPGHIHDILIRDRDGQRLRLEPRTVADGAGLVIYSSNSWRTLSLSVSR
jgi:hypothetical protein